VDGSTLRSKVNGREYHIGDWEMPSLAELRARVAGPRVPKGSLKVSNITGDVRLLHSAPEFNGALFQFASQFNMLEMVGPHVTPEHGVTRYESDRTQGPACAIAAGPATIFRNYFVPVGGASGQTAERQLDGFVDVSNDLAGAIGRQRDSFCKMRNGYALPTAGGLALAARHLRGLKECGLDELRSRLRIGIHTGAEVTDGRAGSGQRVSQAFCSALPVAYSDLRAGDWEPLAGLVLEAAYEATLLAAVLNGSRGGSQVVLLTRLGGGAFGNEASWIDRAMVRALHSVQPYELDVRLVSHGPPDCSAKTLAELFI